MKTFDVIVVGELNADLILQDIPSFPEMGKEKLAKDMVLTMGSASAIMASNIALLGLNVGFSGKLGRDRFGEVVLEGLRDRRVDCSGVFSDPSVKTGVTVVMSFPQDYSMLTYMGAMESFTVDDVDFDYIEKGRHLHFSNFYLQPGMRQGCAELFKRAKKAGLTTSFDPGWDPEENWDRDIFEVFEYIDVFLPNDREALLITGENSLEDALNHLGRMMQTVVVTRGRDGALCRSEGRMISSTVYKVDVKDTTGAGDSFNSGFLYRWLRGGDIRDCMVYGSACGAMATTKMGGSTASPTLEELEAFLIQHPEEIITHE